MTTTAALIARYEDLDSRRFNSQNGDGRADGGEPGRQRKISKVVDELLARADHGDTEAEAFFMR
jgi:hypothetical protein